MFWVALRVMPRLVATLLVAAACIAVVSGKRILKAKPKKDDSSAGSNSPVNGSSLAHNGVCFAAITGACDPPRSRPLSC